MIITTLLYLAKCSLDVALFSPQHHLSYIWYQRHLVKLQQPCVNVTGCKLPQVVRLTFNYEHVGVGLAELGCLELQDFSKAKAGVSLG